MSVHDQADFAKVHDEDDIAPCDTEWGGRGYGDPCDECGHALVAHRVDDRRCTICQVAHDMRVQPWRDVSADAEAVTHYHLTAEQTAALPPGTYRWRPT